MIDDIQSGIYLFLSSSPLRLINKLEQKMKSRYKGIAIDVEVKAKRDHSEFFASRREYK